ncbi:MAG: mechanosensitive ion channel family protein [Dongiaceae bacterium]
MREDLAGLIKRARVILDSYARKGGAVADHEKYLAAVAGLDVDVKDTNAILTAVWEWLEAKDGGLRWAGNIVLFVVTLIAARVLSAVIGHAVRNALVLARTGSGLLQDFLVNSTRKVVLLIGVVVALSMLEVNIGPLIAAIGALGFVVGFALQGTLSNFAAGVMILLYHPFDIGDTVTVAGTTGKVESMTLVSTILHASDNKTVVVPNGSIWGTAIQRHVD